MLFEQFDEVIEISKGMSGDKKYKCIDRNGNQFLLRLSDLEEYDRKLKEYEFLERLNESNLPIPKCVEFEKKEDSVYTLLSWLDGEEVEKILPRLNKKEQYEMGVKAGKILAKIHEAAVLEEKPGNWYDRYIFFQHDPSFGGEVQFDESGCFIGDSWWENTDTQSVMCLGPVEGELFEDREIIKNAVRVITGRKDGEYRKGVAGFGAWEKMLSDDSAFSKENESLLFEKMLCQDDATACLMDGRGCEKF